ILIIFVLINSFYSYHLGVRISSKILDITSYTFLSELRNLNEGISDVLKSISSNDNFLTLYKKSPILKDYIKNSLNLFLSKNIKHVFMITKINNHFAYVYNAKESVPIGFPFMPDRDELPFIFKAYNTKNVIIYKHNGFVKAGFSMYYYLGK
ncbi:MAG: hypothetical protein QXU98_10780, partial [Candidatus Parvarchaeota archaeon]